jgi:hypothetical protein
MDKEGQIELRFAEDPIEPVTWTKCAEDPCPRDQTKTDHNSWLASKFISFSWPVLPLEDHRGMRYNGYPTCFVLKSLHIHISGPETGYPGTGFSFARSLKPKEPG